MHSEYMVIPGLDATHRGPVAKDRDGMEQLVHLHQGDLDGTCGPYSVFMGLVALGLMKRDDVTSWGAYDRRTNLGKLIGHLSENSPSA